MASDLDVAYDVLSEHADRWREQAPELGRIPGMFDGTQFRRLSTPGVFAQVMTQHDALVTKMRDGCQEGAVIWDTIERILRITMLVYRTNQAEARRLLLSLNDSVQADSNHPMAAQLRQTQTAR